MDLTIPICYNNLGIRILFFKTILTSYKDETPAGAETPLGKEVESVYICKNFIAISGVGRAFDRFGGGDRLS